MKSLERRFNNMQKRNPNLGDYVVFAQAVKSAKFSQTTIAQWFNKLVPKDDYSSSEKKNLIRHLVSLSNKDEEGKK